MWFSLFLAFGMVFVGRSTWRRLAHVGMGAAVLLIVVRSERGQFYSPYYAISLNQMAGSPDFTVLTNGSLHQPPSEWAERPRPAPGPRADA